MSGLDNLSLGTKVGIVVAVIVIIFLIMIFIKLYNTGRLHTWIGIFLNWCHPGWGYEWIDKGEKMLSESINRRSRNLAFV